MLIQKESDAGTWVDIIFLLFADRIFDSFLDGRSATVTFGRTRRFFSVKNLTNSALSKVSAYKVSVARKHETILEKRFWSTKTSNDSLMELKSPLNLPKRRFRFFEKSSGCAFSAIPVNKVSNAKTNNQELGH